MIQIHFMLHYIIAKDRREIRHHRVVQHARAIVIVVL